MLLLLLLLFTNVFQIHVGKVCFIVFFYLPTCSDTKSFVDEHSLVCFKSVRKCRL